MATSATTTPVSSGPNGEPSYALREEELQLEFRALLDHISAVIHRELNLGNVRASALHWRLLDGIPNGGALERLAGDHFCNIEAFEESLEEDSFDE